MRYPHLRRGIKANDLIITILLGVVTSMVMVTVLSVNEKKWTAAFLLGFTVLYSSFLLFGKLKNLIFFGSIFFIPISLDVYLWRRETPYIQLHGFPLTAFDILFSALLLLWFFELITKKKKFKIYPYVTMPLFVALVFSAISIFHSTDLALSFCAWLMFVKCFLIFIYFANNFELDKHVYLLLWVAVFSVLFQSLIGITQYVSGSTLGLEILGETAKSYRTMEQSNYILSRVGGTLGSANGLAMFLNGILPALFCALFIKTSKFLKLSIIIAMIFGLATELLTLSRGGWISLFAGILLASFVLFKNKFDSPLKSAAIIIIGTVFTCGVIITFSSTVQKRLFDDNYKSAFGRLFMMDVASNVIKKNSLTGIGINSYTTVMNRYDHTPVSTTYFFPYPVHNSLFLLAAECGVVSLFAIIFILAYVIRRSIPLLSIPFFKNESKSYTFIGVGFFCGFLTWLAHSQIEPFAIYRSFGLWFNLAIIINMLENIKGLACNGKVEIVTT